MHGLTLGMTTRAKVPRPWVVALHFAALVVPCAAGSARAASFAPIASARPLMAEQVVGVAVAFVGSESIDPDDGPAPLTYAWDFGDGGTSAEADPTHVYASAGLFSVTLVVSDGVDLGYAFTEVVVLDPPTSATLSASGPIAAAADGAFWVANDDSGSVTRIDALARASELALGPGVCSVAIAADRASVLAVSRDDGRLWIIDADALAVRDDIVVGRGASAVIALDDGRVAVALGDTSEVVVLDLGTRSEVARVATPELPRALASDGARIYVAHFLTRDDAGRVTIIDLATLATSVRRLAVDGGPDTTSSGAGYPNLLGALALHPSGKELWVGGVKSNTGRGLFVSGQPSSTTNRVRAFAARLPTSGAEEDPRQRIDANDADRVSAIAFTPAGRYAFLAHPGIAAVSVYDVPFVRDASPGDGGTAPIVARLQTESAPNGLALSADGARLAVANALGRSVSIFDIVDPRAPVLIAAVPVTSEPLSAQVALGKRLFHSSRAPQLSDHGYIACASCHPDGGHDGRTWDFTDGGEGLRNTIDLRGKAGMGHGPLHWSANFDEVQDFENDIVHKFGGVGLLGSAGLGEPHAPLAPEHNAGRGGDLDALAAYVSSLGSAPRSPHRQPSGGLTVSQERGKQIFYDAATQCATCHVPPRFTNSNLATFELFDVGTLLPSSGLRLGAPLDGIDTPSLLGAWASAPYLHDGRAASLTEVLTQNARDLHGRVSHLDATQLADLTAFLLALDGSSDELPEPRLVDTATSGARGCSGVAGADGGLVALMAALLRDRLRNRRMTKGDLG